MLGPCADICTLPGHFEDAQIFILADADVDQLAKRRQFPDRHLLGRDAMNRGQRDDRALSRIVAAAGDQEHDPLVMRWAEHGAVE